MPFSHVIRRTNDAKLPMIAHWLVVALCVPFALLPLGSETVLYTVLAVTTATLSYAGYVRIFLSSYFITLIDLQVVPAFLYFFSKIDLQREGRTSWSLRRFSRPSAALGAIFGLAVIVVSMFPGDTPVTAYSISWSPVVLVATGLVCLLTWKCYGTFRQ